MAFINSGGDLTLRLNEQSRRYGFSWASTNNPAMDDTKTYAVASAIVCHRGEWAADVTGEYGSLVHTAKNDTRKTPSQLVAYVLDALEPLVQSGEISNPDATVSGPKGSRKIVVTYHTPKAGRQTTAVPL